MECPILEGGRFIASAPTNDQAIAIWWEDLKRLAPEWSLARPPRESDHTLLFKNGARIIVVGLDKPQRIEGSPIDGIMVDEFADVKPDGWKLNIRPALDTIDRPGWAWLMGVPEGLGYYSEIYYAACRGESEDTEAFHWRSEDILPPEVIAQAKKALDELSYEQEYGASFVNFSGRAYYKFATEKGSVSIDYQPGLPLVTCWDFNNAPGTMSVWQEVPSTRLPATRTWQGTVSCCIGEVNIPQGSNSEIVATRFVNDWARTHTTGEVHLYGDPSGGNKTSSSTTGSDWDIITRVVKNGFGAGRVLNCVARVHPGVRSSINDTNSKCENAAGEIGVVVDPLRAKNMLADFENTTTIKGGSGELDKLKDKGKWTHYTDGFRYYVAEKFPTRKHLAEVIY